MFPQPDMEVGLSVIGIFNGFDGSVLRTAVRRGVRRV